MARVGDSLVLTCKASGCAGDVMFTWASLLDRSLYGKTETNGTVSLQIFNQLGIRHINKVLCKATCTTKGEKAQTSTKVNVYGKFYASLFIVGFYSRTSSLTVAYNFFRSSAIAWKFIILNESTNIHSRVPPK